MVNKKELNLLDCPWELRVEPFSSTQQFSVLAITNEGNEDVLDGIPKTYEMIVAFPVHNTDPQLSFIRQIYERIVSEHNFCHFR